MEMISWLLLIVVISSLTYVVQAGVVSGLREEANHESPSAG
jgi:hypothetical protein